MTLCMRFFMAVALLCSFSSAHAMKRESELDIPLNHTLNSTQQPDTEHKSTCGAFNLLPNDVIIHHILNNPELDIRVLRLVNSVLTGLVSPFVTSIRIRHTDFDAIEKLPTDAFINIFSNVKSLILAEDFWEQDRVYPGLTSHSDNVEVEDFPEHNLQQSLHSFSLQTMDFLPPLTHFSPQNPLGFFNTDYFHTPLHRQPISSLPVQTTFSIPTGELLDPELDEATKSQNDFEKQKTRIIRNFLSQLPYVTDLTVCVEVEDDEAKNIALFPIIERLDCILPNASLETLTEWFEALPNLTHFSLCKSPDVADNTLVALSTVTTLKYLELSDCEMTENHELCFFPHLRNLEYLALSNFDEITDIGLAYIAQVPSLTHLDLNDFPQITETGVINLVGVLPNLTQLNIKNCELIAEECIQRLKVELMIRRCQDQNH